MIVQAPTAALLFVLISSRGLILMRRTLTGLILLAALGGGACGARAEHIAPDELAFRSLQSQNVQELANEFK